MSDRRDAVTLRFRVLGRSGANGDPTRWLGSVATTSVREIDFGARRAGEPGSPRRSELPFVAPPANDVDQGGQSRDASCDPASEGALEVRARADEPAELEPVAHDALAVFEERPDQERASSSVASPAIVTPSVVGPSAGSPSVVNPPLEAALEALATARAELLAQAEGELVELAIEVARSILATELETRPELHRTLVRAALEVLRGEATPRVRVSPEAFDAILANSGSGTVEAHGRRVELEPDPSLRGAGALLEGGASSVDGRLEARLERVREALLVARRTMPLGVAA